MNEYLFFKNPTYRILCAVAVYFITPFRKQIGICFSIVLPYCLSSTKLTNTQDVQFFLVGFQLCFFQMAIRIFYRFSGSTEKQKVLYEYLCFENIDGFRDF